MNVDADLTDDGKRIVVRADWAQKDQVKLVPGSSWNGEERIWTVPRTWAACLQLRGIFKEHLRVGQRLAKWSHVEYMRVGASMNLRDVKEFTGEYSGNQDLKSFQRAGVTFMQTAESALLGDDMGTGKTIQGLELLRQTPNALPALVVCPNSVKTNWRTEAQRWFPETTVYVVEGPAQKRRKTLELAARQENCIVVINYEALRQHSRLSGYGSIALKRCGKCEKGSTLKESLCEVCPRELNQVPWRSVIVDEAHRMKDPKAKQTRAIWAIGKGESVVHRIPMTGTPIADNIGDLWPLMRFIAPDEYPNKSKYLDRYAVMTMNGWGGVEIGGINPETRAEFFKILDPRYRRTAKAEVLKELPPLVSIKRYVQMTPGQEKSYRELEAKAMTRLPDGSLMIPRRDIASRNRAFQLTSATLTQGPETLQKVANGDGTFRTEMLPTYDLCEPSPKLDAMMEILEDYGDKPIVICALHRQLIEMAAARLEKAGISHGLVTGAVPQWQREANLAMFQRGDLQVLLFTIQAGGVGLTMTAADTILFLQRSWSMIENRQATDRINRIGAERHKSLTVIDLICEGTVEVDQITKIWAKHERAEEVNRDREREDEAADRLIDSILQETREEDDLLS